MWRFWRREEPDPLLEGVKKGVIATLAMHGAQLEQIVKVIQGLRADIEEASKIERRLTALEGRHGTLDRAVNDNLSRLDASLIQVRGMATGGARRGKGERAEAEQVGERFLAAVSDPRRRAELIRELQAAGAENGAPSAVDAG